MLSNKTAEMKKKTCSRVIFPYVLRYKRVIQFSANNEISLQILAFSPCLNIFFLIFINRKAALVEKIK